METLHEDENPTCCHDLPCFLASAFCPSYSQLPGRRDGAQQACDMPSTFAGTFSVLSRSGSLTGDPETTQVMAKSCMKPGVRACCAQGWTQPSLPPSPAEPWMMMSVRKCCSCITDLFNACVRGTLYIHKGENTFLFRHRERYKTRQGWGPRAWWEPSPFHELGLQHTITHLLGPAQAKPP